MPAIRVCTNADCQRFGQITNYKWCTGCGQAIEWRALPIPQARLPIAANAAPAASVAPSSASPITSTEPTKMCARIGCTKKGLGIEDERCSNCGFNTQPYRQLPSIDPPPPSPVPAAPAWTPGRLRFSDTPQPQDSTLPSTTTTIWITIFFGVFGLIPATIHTNRARDLGVRDNRYYKAFGWTFGIATVGWILFLVTLASCVNSADSNYTSNYGGLPQSPTTSTHIAHDTRS